MDATLWEVFRVVNDWLRFADAKAGAVLAGNIALAAAVCGLLQQADKPFAGRAWLAYLLVGALLAGCTSAVLSGLCLLPRIRLKAPRVVEKTADTLLFFGHIASIRGADEYHLNIKQRYADHREISRDLAYQVHVNSALAARKFSLASWAVMALLAGLGILAISAAAVLVVG